MDKINSNLLAAVRATKGAQDNDVNNTGSQALNAGGSNLYGGLLLQQLQQLQNQQNQKSLIGGVEAMDPNMLAGLGLSAASGNGNASGILGMMGLAQQQSVPDLSDRKKELSGGAKKRKKKEAQLTLQQEQQQNKDQQTLLKPHGAASQGTTSASKDSAKSETPTVKVGTTPALGATGESGASEEAPTRRRSRSKSSNYRGVSRCAKDGRWQARIRIGRAVKYLGRYRTEMDAAKRYDIAAKRYHGSRAVLNFGELTNLTIADLEEGDKGPAETKEDEEEIRLHQQKRNEKIKAKRSNQVGATRMLLPGQSKTKKQRRSSAMPGKVAQPPAAALVQPRRNSVPALSTDINNQSTSYQQLLAQMNLLGAVSVREQLRAQQENHMAQTTIASNGQQGASNSLLISLAAGMLSGTGHLSDYRIASTVPSDAMIASQLSPASKSMTGAISGLISLNQTQL